MFQLFASLHSALICSIFIEGTSLETVQLTPFDSSSKGPGSVWPRFGSSFWIIVLVALVVAPLGPLPAELSGSRIPRTKDEDFWTSIWYAIYICSKRHEYDMGYRKSVNDCE